jgi:hypothetical protein
MSDFEVKRRYHPGAINESPYLRLLWKIIQGLALFGAHTLSIYSSSAYWGNAVARVIR